jgi:hypothetical protein
MLKGAETDPLQAVQEIVILPQISSICRLHGSRQAAVDLLVGDSREAFQTDTSEELEAVLEAKNLTLLLGLTRHIYVPAAVREPMQQAKIADELKLTRDQEQLTAEAEGDLKEAKAKVTLEERRTNAETTKLVAQAIAEGEKKAREIEATTEKLRAEVDAKTAAVQAQITTTVGEAEAKKLELSNQAEAERYRQYVQSLGGPDAYNRYVFAEGLPADLRLGVFYAGPGTLWTDLKGFEQVMLGKLAADSAAPPPRPAHRPAPPRADRREALSPPAPTVGPPGTRAESPRRVSSSLGPSARTPDPGDARAPAPGGAGLASMAAAASPGRAPPATCEGRPTPCGRPAAGRPAEPIRGLPAGRRLAGVGRALRE